MSAPLCLFLMPDCFTIASGIAKQNINKMKVCIAEKPSVARDLARILGASQRRDGYFEGNGFQVTWTFGHLCTLKEPHEYNANWKRWYLNDLPIVPSRFGIKVIENDGIKKQFGIIENLVQKADEVINCGDAGQEGELIQRWVLKKANCTCPVKRLWISSLTDEAIKEGFSKLYEEVEFEPVYMAGMSRAIGDWLLGINATRLYTVKYGQRGQLLSVGRVQTPTLALIVDRQKEIENFKPEPYWELRTKYRDVWFNCSEGRYKDKVKATDAVQKIIGKIFTIISFETKEGTEYAPKLYDLTSLQVDCNNKFGFAADKTLKTVQALYEKKVTSYPRVDTTFLSDDLYPKIQGILKGIKGYEEYTAALLGQKIKKTKRVFDNKKVTDHHAIIPTGVPANNITADERQVYDLIARRFIAAFYPDCKVLKTAVVGSVEDIEFKANGKQILEPGWRLVLTNFEEQNTDTQIMPEFMEGESGEHEPDLQEKETKPPKYFTEASLLRSMETAGKQIDDDELRDALKESGIGRPSTRAGIIETLFKRKYIIRDKKRLLATETGVELINTIRNELLKSAELTGHWEKKLRQIEGGEYKPADFIAELKDMVTHVVNEVKQDRSAVQIPVHEPEPVEKPKPKQNNDIQCPKCKSGAVIKGKAAYGCSRWQEGCDFKVPFILSGKKLTQNQMNKLLSSGKTPLIKSMKLGEKKLDGYFVLNNNFIPVFEEQEKEKLVCPVCKQGEIVKGKKAWGCNRYAQGCRLVIPFVVHQKNISESALEQLIKNGKTNTLKDFTVNNTKTDGALFIDENGLLKWRAE